MKCAAEQKRGVPSRAGPTGASACAAALRRYQRCLPPDEMLSTCGERSRDWSCEQNYRGLRPLLSGAMNFEEGNIDLELPRAADWTEAG